MNKIYTDEFIVKAQVAKLKGFNIYQLTGRYYKQSKLVEKLPEAVLLSVIDEFLARGENISDPWPYFLKVLKNKSQTYFAEKNTSDGEKYKNERPNPFLIANILKGMAS